LSQSLHETVADTTLVLQQEHGAELGQRVGSGIVERPQDALSILDRQGDDDGLKCQRLFEHAPRRFVDETGECSNIVVGNPEPASIISATLYEHAFAADGGPAQ
jgi:hypothetical protein